MANLWSVIGISMLASVVFGIIDALNFFLVEEQLTNFWKQFSFLDETTIPILNGGISAAISIVIAYYVEHYISTHFNVLKHPALEGIGIIIGTVIVLVGYKILTRDPKPLVLHVRDQVTNNKQTLRMI